MKYQLIRSLLIASLAALVASVGIAFAVNITGTDSSNSSQIASVGYVKLSTTDTITAFAGGGITSATALNSGYNRVTVVASAGDSVKLPACRAGASGTGMGNTVGLQVIVTNADAADSMDVFPQSGDGVNALSPSAAYAMAANKTAMFICGTATSSAGIWYSILGG